MGQAQDWSKRLHVGTSSLVQGLVTQPPCSLLTSHPSKQKPYQWHATSNIKPYTHTPCHSILASGQTIIIPISPTQHINNPYCLTSLNMHLSPKSQPKPHPQLTSTNLELLPLACLQRCLPLVLRLFHPYHQQPPHIPAASNHNHTNLTLALVYTTGLMITLLYVVWGKKTERVKG